MAVVGTLVQDPDGVACVINHLLDSETSARALALHVPHGHVIDIEDVVRTDRALIRFDAASVDPGLNATRLRSS